MTKDKKEATAVKAIEKHLKHHGIKFTELRNIEINSRYVDFDYKDKDGDWMELNIPAVLLEEV